MNSRIQSNSDITYLNEVQMLRDAFRFLEASQLMCHPGLVPSRICLARLSIMSICLFGNQHLQFIRTLMLKCAICWSMTGRLWAIPDDIQLHLQRGNTAFLQS